MLPATHVANTGRRCIFFILTFEKCYQSKLQENLLDLMLVWYLRVRGPWGLSFNTSFLLLFIAFTGTHRVLTFVLLQRNAQRCID